jgi:probable F420-dependent oxidoreductase
MKFGLNIVPVPGQELPQVGRRAEELGFDGLYYGEHIAVPKHLKTPYPGKVGYNYKTIQLECYVALGALAAVTSKVRLGTGITILPIRHPLQTARAITTIDNISNGRFDLIFGVGSIPDEYEAMGVDFHSRGAILDEWLDIFAKLWTQEEIEHRGRHYSFETIGFEPKPVQVGGPPLWSGARSEKGLERAVRRCVGWYGAVYGAEDVRSIKAMLAPYFLQYDRDPSTFRYMLIHAAGESIIPTDAEIAAYAAEGVEGLILSPFKPANTRQSASMEKLEACAAGLKGHLPG